MFTRLLIFVLFSGIFLGCKDSSTGHSEEKVSISQILLKYKNAASLPSIAGALVKDGNLQFYAQGLRKNGTQDSVAVNDKFFIGSNLKAMTSTMIAILKEHELISWESRVIDIFPEFQNKIPVKFENVTLRQLLTHRGGIAPITSLEDFAIVPAFTGSIIEQRHQFSEWVLNNSNVNEIGNYNYSNAGYVIASAMAEKVTSQTWENLITDKLFIPLGINPVFNWPAENGVDAPWGHTFESGNWAPFNPDSVVQFPKIFNPAGNLSISLSDYMKFIKLHLDGLTGRANLITEASFKFLHNPIGDYSMGWSETILNGLNIPVSYHLGSDGTFEAIVIIEPATKKAAAVFTNCASDEAELAVNNCALEMLTNP